MDESRAQERPSLATHIHRAALVGGLYLKESMCSKKMDLTWEGRWDLCNTNTSPAQICLGDCPEPLSLQSHRIQPLREAGKDWIPESGLGR